MPSSNRWTTMSEREPDMPDGAATHTFAPLTFRTYKLLIFLIKKFTLKLTP